MMIHLVQLLVLMTTIVSVGVEKSVGATRTRLSLLALLMIMVEIVAAVGCVVTHRTRRLTCHINSATLTLRRSLILILLILLSHRQMVLPIPILLLSPLSVQKMMILPMKMMILLMNKMEVGYGV
jgi:hypothetical protein